MDAVLADRQLRSLGPLVSGELALTSDAAQSRTAASRAGLAVVGDAWASVKAHRSRPVRGRAA